MSDTAAWERIEAEWNELFDRSANSAPPLRFDWLWQWWHTYSGEYARHGGLRILTMRRAGRLIGVLPLYEGWRGQGSLGIRRLGFISTGERYDEEVCAEYMDLLHLPGEEDACLDAIAGWLSRTRSWDVLELPDISERSTICRLKDPRGAWSGAECRHRGVCPIADISGGLDAYLSRLSRNSRQQYRRLLRGAEHAGATLELAEDESSSLAAFADLVRLHQQRWVSAGQPGCFASQRFSAFHRELARSWTPAGKSVLARLLVENRPLGVIYGFRVQSKFDFYQAGFSIDQPAGLKSPGIVAFLMLMDRLAERGVEKFDFLKGSYSYKDRLSTEQCALVELCQRRWTLRSALHDAADLLARGARKGRRALTGRLCQGPRARSSTAPLSGECP